MKHCILALSPICKSVANENCEILGGTAAYVMVIIIKQGVI